jgi:hypothetical protein
VSNISLPDPFSTSRISDDSTCSSTGCSNLAASAKIKLKRNKIDGNILIKLYPAAPGRIFSDQFNNFISI